MAENGRQLSFGAVVREYILPYNTLFAISGVLAFVLGLVSPFLVIAFGVSLLGLGALIVAANHLSRDALLAWGNSDPDHGRIDKLCVRLVWPHADATLRSSGIFWVIVVLGIAVTLYGTTGAVHKATDFARSAGTSGAEGVRSASSPRILVLPLFVTSSAVTEQMRLLASGVSDDIIAGLSRFASVSVLGRHTSSAIASSNPDHATLRDTYTVNYVVSGGLQAIGDHFQLHVELLDTATGETIWSERLSRPLVDVVNVAEEVVPEIVGRVASQIMHSEVRPARRSLPSSLPAYELTVKARELWRSPSKGRLAEAQDLLRKAIAIDPGYAPAHAYLAYTHLTAYTSSWSDGFARTETLYAMLTQADKALELDPSNAAARAAQAIAYAYLGRHDEALLAARESLKLNRSDPEQLARVGKVLSLSGEHEAAVTTLQNARELDPLGPAELLDSLARAHFLAANYEAAIKNAQVCLERSPIDACRQTRAAALAAAGRTEEAALTWAEIAAKHGNPDPAALVSPTRASFRKNEDRERLVAALRRAREAADGDARR